MMWLGELSKPPSIVVFRTDVSIALLLLTTRRFQTNEAGLKAPTLLAH